MKKSFCHITLFLFAILLFAYCDEPQLNVPEYTPKIAVDGFLEAGHTPVLKLTYSSPFISEYDSMDFVDMVKFNVSAFVITEEDDTIGFTRKTNTGEFPPFRYTMSPSDLIAEAGKTYRLLIIKQGEDNITASTTVPLHPPHIIDLFFAPHEVGDSLGRYAVSIENKDEGLYLFIQNKQYDEVSFYPVRLPVRSNRLFDAENELLFYLQYHKATNIWLDSEDLGADTLDTHALGYYNKNDSVQFKISTIDEEAFNVMSSIFLDTEYPDNPFRPLSQLPVSNVSNGIGHWTGMNSVYWSVKHER